MHETEVDSGQAFRWFYVNSEQLPHENGFVSIVTLGQLQGKPLDCLIMILGSISSFIKGSSLHNLSNQSNGKIFETEDADNSVIM